MRRVEIGQDNVQGIDYTYTINGWLKAINNPSLEPTLDPGRDGKSGSSEAHALFGRDAFGMFLAYHTDDFKHTGSYADAATTTESSNTWHQAPLSSLYNGNIGAWAWGSRTSTGYKENLASRYRYDLLNRIRVDTLSTRVSNTWTATPNYRSSYTYDGNGNLKSLVRVDSAGTLMDSLVYRYQTNRNRLTHVDDPGGVAGNHSFDVDDQDTNTYTYDASGNIIGDTASGITAIVWTPSNKIQSITKGSTSKLEYTYDAMGNRVVKRYYQPTSTLKSTTWYARDAQGNILSVYERPHADSAIKQSEVHIYGSSRLGIEQRGITYGTSNYAWIGSEQHRNAGSKRYELTDHLGNMRVTISDLLIARPTGFGDTTQDAEVIDRRDYYPFGMEMPGRRWRASGEDAARFGFNGKENDNEVKGEGNQQDYGFRIYDPRIAKFLSVDPLTRSYPSWSPYPFAMNRPIDGIDIDGKEWGESQFAEANRKLIVTRWLYAKVTKEPTAGLDNSTMWSILKKAREILVTAMNSGDGPGTDYQMSESDVKFNHHKVGSIQADHDIDIVIAFERGTEDRVGGKTEPNGFGTESGDVTVYTHVKGANGKMVMRPIDDIASTTAHELGHTLGLPDANLLQSDPALNAINVSVGALDINLMNQQSTLRQGPALTTVQQKAASQNIQNSAVYRESLQAARSERNGTGSQNVP